MPELHVLRVFCGPAGGGNPLGVFLDGGEVPEGRRQAVARELGFSETVFVDAADSGRIRIFTPQAELGFAGHPVVGTAWLLARTRGELAVLYPPAGSVPLHEEGGLTFAAGRPQWSPDWDLVELASAADVDALEGPPDNRDAVEAWAWLDEEAGLVRARVFAPGYGIAEDEATGSAAIKLSARLDRELDIRQGIGSQIIARPRPDGMVDIGGRVELDEVRELDEPA